MKLHNGLSVDSTYKNLVALVALAKELDCPKLKRASDRLKADLREFYREEFLQARKTHTAVVLETHLGKIPWDEVNPEVVTIVTASPHGMFQQYEAEIDLDDSGTVVMPTNTEWAWSVASY